MCEKRVEKVYAKKVERRVQKMSKKGACKNEEKKARVKKKSIKGVCKDDARNGARAKGGGRRNHTRITGRPTTPTCHNWLI